MEKKQREDKETYIFSRFLLFGLVLLLLAIILKLVFF